MNIFENRPTNGMDFHVGITVTKGIARGIGNELELLGAQNWIYGANGVSELFSGGGLVELLLGAFLGGGCNLSVQKTADSGDHFDRAIPLSCEWTSAGKGGVGGVVMGAEAEDGKKNGAHA